MNIKHYVKPQTINEAYDLLIASKQNAILGGGLWMKYGKKNIDTMIDISHLGLNTIETTKKSIIIGSQVTLRDLELHPEIKAIGKGFLSEAIGQVVGVAFRNLATIGGTIVGKYPFSDVVTPLLCLNVTLKFYPDREISLVDFLESKERSQMILTHIIIQKETGRGFFKKVSNTIVDFSILNVACYYDQDLHIVIGARPGKPIIVSGLKGDMSEAEIEKHIENNVEFSDDERGSKVYRQILAKTYVKRGIKEVYPYES